MHLVYLHHGHEHSSQHSSPEEQVALLSYMWEHNKSHADELHEVAHELEHSDKTEAAEHLHEAVRFFEQGNQSLALALDMLKKDA